jgi:electron transport complex protein RnfC
MEANHKLQEFNGGLKLKANKEISNTKLIKQINAQKHYVVPIQQHIGESGDIIVKTGERVLKGQMLAAAKNLISASIHSPVSGKVTEIGKHPVPHPSGLNAKCIVIENDFKDEWIEKHPVGSEYNNMNSHNIRKLIRNAGIVGLGGAAFPTAVKQTEINIETLIINGVECEPYITCDDALMRERAKEIISGADVIGHVIKARECIIAVEDNKPEAIGAMQKAIDEDGTGFFSIRIIPTIYPSGGEKQIVKIITGKEVPVNGLPADIDLLCQNVGTAYAIHKIIFEDEPLISRIVTVTGKGITNPQNIEALIGTTMQHCVSECGGYTKGSNELIMGGPMMGFTIENDTCPVIKATNCLLVVTEQEVHPATMSAHMPCIRCGLCVDVCPANLLPQQLYWYASTRNFERATEHHLFDCIECGCCSYVCPSQIPLVQYYRFSKSEIWEQEQDRKKSAASRERFEFREKRLERQKNEREERLRQKREMLEKKKNQKKKNQNKKPENTETGKEKTSKTSKEDIIAAAMARVNAKKEEKNIKQKNIDGLSETHQTLINEVDARRSTIKKILE